MSRIRVRKAEEVGEPCCTASNIFRVLILLVAGALVALHLIDTRASLASIACSATWTVQPRLLNDDPSTQTTTTTTTKEDTNLAPLSPLHHQRQQLTSSTCPSPSFVNQGGVFVFFHLAKAGGTTVRKLFQELPSKPFVMSRAVAQTADITVRRFLVNATNHQPLLVEFHDHGDPSIPKYKGYLQDWRKLAALHNKPLFVFTVVRDPIDYALSYFTYQNIGTAQHENKRVARRYYHPDGSGRKAQMTPQDLIDFTLPSPQCLFFARGEFATTSEFHIYGSKFDPSQECPQVYQDMTQHLDWIGTLENMQGQLLPLLTYLSDNDPDIGSYYARKNQQIVLPFVRFNQQAKANNATLEALQPKLQADQDLYQRVQEDYQFQSFWSPCIYKQTINSV